MKLGFVSAILDQSTYEEMMDTASELGFECVEVACWPHEKRNGDMQEYRILTRKGCWKMKRMQKEFWNMRKKNMFRFLRLHTIQIQWMQTWIREMQQLRI